ncbi:MAG: hypothetical protein Q8L37_02900 [Candidatus Gottesmanbacteria bacterium]|nr:hypothetical protein [Candidatus Gottesmanbacteria bacterium]
MAFSYASLTNAGSISLPPIKKLTLLLTRPSFEPSTSQTSSSKATVGNTLAVRKQPRRKNWIVIVYKERDATDGFVLTAYVTTDFRWLLKRKILWSKPS